MAGCRKWLGVGVLAAVVAAGCDPVTMLYFLSSEDKEAPRSSAWLPRTKKEVKVAILAYSAMETRSEFIHVDHALADLLARQLAELSKSNGEKVILISPRLVEEYKNKHPSRRGCDPIEVGKHFKTDYVVYLELNQMSLYEAGTYPPMLRGHADISVALVDMNDPEARDSKQFTCVYPNESRGAIDVSPEMPPTVFREQFLAFVAKRLSWYFAPHSRRDREVELP